MMYVLMLVQALLMTGNTALTKIFQKNSESDLFHLAVYNLINAGIACVYFYAAAAFTIDINAPTVIYAVVYALIIVINISIQIIAMAQAPVSVVVLSTMAGGVLIPSLFGIIYFDEPLTVNLVISSILIIVAAVLPFMGKHTDKRKLSGLAAIVCGIMFFLNGASVVLMQLYAKDKSVCDSTSMFFLTNVAIVVICVIVLRLFIMKKTLLKKESMLEIHKAFDGKQKLTIASKTALANIASILQMIILAKMNASTFAILNSSLSLIGATAVSALLFREKQKKSGIIAVGLAILAIIINPR